MGLKLRFIYTVVIRNLIKCICMNQLDKIAIIESSMKMLYREISRDWDTLNNDRNCNKNGTVWFHSAVMHPKDADGIANDVDPDQTAPV